MKIFLFALPLLLISPFAYTAQEGQTAPKCSATMADANEKLDLSQYKGKVLLLDFWATWCPPCKKSMPFLNNLRNERLRDGFEIVAINVDEDSDEAKQFLKENPVDYKIAFDPGGDCPKAFDVKVMPSSYLIDKNGAIRKIHMGFRDEDQAMISEQISKLLAE